MALGKIAVVLDLDSNEFQTKLMRAGAEVQTFSRRVDSSLDSVSRLERAIVNTRTALRDFAITAASIRGTITTIRNLTLDWVVGLGDASGKIERLQVMMEAFSTQLTKQGRELEAASNVQFLLDMAKKVPFSMDELANSFAKFKSVGIDPTTGAMHALTDAIARFGGSNDELHRATVAIQQMAGKGVISMEELRQQLGEAVPTAINTMARALNMTVAELQAKVSSGQVAAGTALKKFFVELQLENEGSADKMMNTWTGLMSRLSTGWMLFLKQIGDEGFYAEIKAALQDLVNTLTGIDGQRFAHSLGKGLTMLANTVSALTKAIVTSWDTITKVAEFGAMLFGARAMQLALVGLINTVLNLQKAFVTLRVAMALDGMLAGVAVGAQAATVGVTGLAVAVRGLGVAARFMAGPWGILISGVAALGAYMFMTSNNAADLAKEIIKTKGAFASTDDIKTLEGEIDSALKKVSMFGDAMVAAKKRVHDEGGTAINLGDLEYEQAEYEKAQKHLMNLEEARRLALEQIQKRETDEFISNKAKQVDAALENNTKQFEADEALFYARIANMDELQRRQGKADLLAKKAAADELAVQKALDEARKSSDHSRLNQAWIAYLEARLNQVKVKSGEAKEALIDLQNELTQPKKDQKAAFQSLLDGINETIAKLKYKNEHPGSSGFLGEIEEKFDEIARKSKLLPAQIEEFRVKIMAAAKAAEAAQGQDKGQSFFNRLSKDLAGVNAVIDGSQPKISKWREEWDQFKDVVPPALREKVELLLKELETRGEIADQIKKTGTLEEEMVRKTKALGDDALDGKEKMIAAHDEEIAKYHQILEVEGMTDEMRRKREEEFYAFKQAMDAKLDHDLESSLVKQAKHYEQFTDRVSDAMTRMFDGLTEEFVKFAMGQKQGWRDLVQEILRDIIRIMIQRALIAPMERGVDALMTGLLNSSNGAGSSGDATYGLQSDGFTYMVPDGASANGNVMTPAGLARLEPFSKGGVANRPMVSLFGEGALPEAYVPLPDGRSIPVSIQGGAQQSAPNMNVQVNLINESGQSMSADATDKRFDGEKMILDVVMRATGRAGSFRDTLKSNLT